MLHQIKPNSKITIDVEKQIEDDLEYYQAKLKIQDNKKDENDNNIAEEDSMAFVGKGATSSLAKKGAFKRAVIHLQNNNNPSFRYIFF